MTHALLLALSLSLQGGPVHAGLHPAGADVYLEIGDVASALAALDEAPLLLFARDERMKELRGLAEQAGISLERSLAETVLAGIQRAWPSAQAGDWMSGLRTVSASMWVLAPEAELDFATFFALEFASAEQAAVFRNAMLSAREHEPVSGAIPGMERLKGGDTETFGEPWCAVAGTRFLLGTPDAKPEEYLARAEGQVAGFGGGKEFQERLGAFAAPAGTPLGWFALSRSLRELSAAAGEDDGFLAALERLPDGFNPFASPGLARMSFAGGRFVTEMFASEPAASSATVERAWLAPAPAASMLVYATAFDGAAAGQRLRSLLAADEESTAALTAIEEKVGFGIGRVLAHLGPAMTVYSGPLTGLGLPDTRVWIACDDAAAFTGQFESLVGALTELVPGIQVKTRPYKVKVKDREERLEVPVTTVTLPPNMVQIPMISISPSFAPVGDRLVFGMNSMDVKNELKRVHAGEGEPITADADPLGTMGFALPDGARSVLVMDWAKLLGGVVGMVQAFAGMAAPGDLPFDPKQLPPAELFAQYFKPTFHYSKSAAGGTYRRNEASFGPETWLGIVALMSNAPFGGERAAAPPDALAPPEPAGDGK